ncbi:MAG: FAD-dependent monooxygenase [Nocardiopsaceae bacterium]|nr:FAD-dependent monooxygenase [Nocardiopsaceae bacterium]
MGAIVSTETPGPFREGGTEPASSTGLSPSTGLPSIAIIGAGIGGLTLAALLLEQGASVRVYEQADAFARVGTGIQMGPNAMKVLTRLGLHHDLAKVAYSPATLANREWDTGTLTFELPVGAAAVQRYGAPYYLLHRGDLHELLQRRVRPDVIELGAKLVSLAERPDGVELRFDDGSTAGADLVVGADGVHSAVRDSLFEVAEPSFTGKVAYRAVFPVELVTGGLPGPSTKWWGPDRHIVIYYVSAGRELYFTTAVPDAGWDVESYSARGDLDELRAAFAGFHDEVQSVLRACPAVHKWAIYDRDPLPSWHTGRVVLLGDACHPMTPYMAQGAATAMEDAVVLARCLRETEPGAALARFEAARKPRTSAIQASSRANDWLRKPTDPTWVYGYDALSAPLDGDTEGAGTAWAAHR